MNNLAPIVLFVYNRPWHTEQTLNYLILNELASESTLYIFADGVNDDATLEQKDRINDVRQFIKSKQWCKHVIINESDTNKGLADSIIGGVTEVLSKHERVIVMEDDLVTSTGFLRYMNNALEMYKDDLPVAGVTGFSFIKSKEETFFLHLTSSLGWGTWRRVWSEANFDTHFWLSKLTDKEIISKFNLDNHYDYYQMLKNQSSGKAYSWAVRFYCNCFFKNQYFLFPKETMLFHIGYDEGTNCSGAEKSDLTEYRLLLPEIKLIKHPIIENIQNKILLQEYLRPKTRSNSILNRICRKIRKILNL